MNSSIQIFRSLITHLMFAIIATLGFASTTTADVVSVDATVENLDGEPTQFQVTVSMTIKDGWHTYDSVPPGNPSPTTTIDLELPDGVKTVGQWKRPTGHAYGDEEGLTVFKNDVTFTQILEVEIKNPAEIEVKVQYQACNDKTCQPPQTFKTKLKVATDMVASKSESGSVETAVKDKSAEDVEPAKVASTKTNAKPKTAKPKLKPKTPFKFSNEHFEAPIRLVVDENPLNTTAKQKYPSPAMYDIDGDDQIELVVGDIFGRLMVYENSNESSGDPVWAKEVALENSSNKKIKVSNW